MKILVTGKNGQVGWELRRTLAPLGKVIALDREALDLSDVHAIRRLVQKTEPDLIVNAAAYTAVDKAESEPDLAMLINGTVPGILAEEARDLGAAIVHYSTDYVFDGTKDSPYVEDDTPNPLNVYGRTKLAGEQAIQAVGVPHLILRTSWVYGARGRNFLGTIRRLARERDELRIVDDQYGAPTWSRMIAEITAQILAQRLSLRFSGLSEVSGVYHLTAGGRTSWHGFARAILDQEAAASRLKKIPRLTPIPTSEYPLPAKRPMNSVLSNEKLYSVFGLGAPQWDAALELCMQEFLA
jgi:dTDP-4-dehydrorhamnose reductase